MAGNIVPCAPPDGARRIRASDGEKQNRLSLFIYYDSTTSTVCNPGARQSGSKSGHLDCSIRSKDHLSPRAPAPLAAFADFKIFWHRTGVLARFQRVVGAAALETGRAAATFRKTLNRPSVVQMLSQHKGCQCYFFAAIYALSISLGFAAFVELPVFHNVPLIPNAHHLSQPGVYFVLPQQSQRAIPFFHSAHLSEQRQPYHNACYQQVRQ